jgi:thioredoxin 1
MNKTQMLALAAVVAVLVVIVAAKAGRSTEPPPAPDVQAALTAPEPAGEPAAEVAAEPAAADEQAAAGPAPAVAGETADAAPKEGLPTLLELGSVGCKPCEYMAPIIDALEKELAGKVVVEFHDVGQNAAIAEKYQIMTIPTQVFLDADGKELFRHIGVFEKEDILAKLNELGMLKE